LKEHLTDTSDSKGKADLGVVVDPDVDRLAFCEDGEMFGEEYTLWLVPTMCVE
jgi:phosphomannomutase